MHQQHGKAWVLASAPVTTVFILKPTAHECRFRGVQETHAHGPCRPRGCGSHAAFPLQHQRSHEDPAALRFNFYDVVTTGPQAPPALKALQHRCLAPGWYAVHIERWLAHFAASQVTSRNRLRVLSGRR